MAKFESKDGKLFIDGKRVIKAWESFNGWYWFAVEKIQTQDSIMSDGSIAENDTIWFGFVQGLEEEWGDFSQAEIESLGARAWRIPEKNLPYSGRR